MSDAMCRWLKASLPWDGLTAKGMSVACGLIDSKTPLREWPWGYLCMAHAGARVGMPPALVDEFESEEKLHVDSWSWVEDQSASGRNS